MNIGNYAYIRDNLGQVVGPISYVLSHDLIEVNIKRSFDPRDRNWRDEKNEGLSMTFDLTKVKEVQIYENMEEAISDRFEIFV